MLRIEGIVYINKFFRLQYLLIRCVFVYLISLLAADILHLPYRTSTCPPPHHINVYSLRHLNV